MQDYNTSDGTAVRDYIHPSDLATGHLAALLRLRETNVSDVFNLGNGVGDTVLQVCLHCFFEHQCPFTLSG